MGFQPGSNLYGVGVGTHPENVEVPHYDNRVPATTDINYPVGKRWVNVAGNAEYTLTSLTSSAGIVTANWSLLGTNTGALNTLTGDSGGAISPSAGNITLAGTANQITTVGSGSTITYSLIGPYTPATYTAHGVLLGEGTSSIVATTAGTNGQLLIGSTGADPAFSTLTSSGSTITVTGGAHTLNIDVAAPLNVAHGGTGATSLTAHGVLLGEGTSAITPTAAGTTGQVLIGSTGADPAFGALGVNSALTAHGVLLGENNSAIVATTAGTNGQVLLGSTGADPAFGTLTTSTGLAFTTGAASLAINTTGGGLKANAEAGAGPFSGATQNSYVFAEAAQTTVSLPTTSAVGDFFLVCGTNANTGGWVVSQAAGQQIFNATNHSTSGATGTISTAAANTSALLVCTAANTTWIAIATVGTVTYT
jgi:hypothetical protein